MTQPVLAQDFFTWLTSGHARTELARPAESTGRELKRTARSQTRHARKERPRQDTEIAAVDALTSGAAAKLRIECKVPAEPVPSPLKVGRQSNC